MSLGKPTGFGEQAASRPLASLHSDVHHGQSRLAAHAPRRLTRRCCSARARRRFRLRWFRFGKKSEEQAPIEAAAPAEVPEPVKAEPAEEAEQPSTTKPKRRRGSRGGRRGPPQPPPTKDKAAQTG